MRLLYLAYTLIYSLNMTNHVLENYNKTININNIKIIYPRFVDDIDGLSVSEHKLINLKKTYLSQLVSLSCR